MLLLLRYSLLIRCTDVSYFHLATWLVDHLRPPYYLYPRAELPRTPDEVAAETEWAEQGEIIRGQYEEEERAKNETKWNEYREWYASQRPKGKEERDCDR